MRVKQKFDAYGNPVLRGRTYRIIHCKRFSPEAFKSLIARSPRSSEIEAPGPHDPEPPDPSW